MGGRRRPPAGTTPTLLRAGPHYSRRTGTRPSRRFSPGCIHAAPQYPTRRRVGVAPADSSPRDSAVAARPLSEFGAGGREAGGLPRSRGGGAPRSEVATNSAPPSTYVGNPLEVRTRAGTAQREPRPLAPRHVLTEARR